MADEKLMDKVMSEEELEMVVGGAKVFILTYLKNGKIDAFYGEFTGDMKALQTLVNGGSVKSLKARFILVTFPTRTLGGRNVGMERTYSDWFASEIAGHFEIAEVFTAGSELCYILKEA